MPNTNFGQLETHDISDNEMIEAVQHYVPEHIPKPKVIVPNITRPMAIMPNITYPVVRYQSNDYHRPELPPYPITDDMIETIPFETRNVRPPDPNN